MNVSHFSAVLARLEANAALTVHDGEAPLNADGTVVYGTYCILFGGSPARLAPDRVTQPPRSADPALFRYVVRSVGSSAYAVRRVAEAVQTQLVGFKPTVAGRTCEAISLSDSDEFPKQDTAVSPPLFFLEDDYELRSYPA